MVKLKIRHMPREKRGVCRNMDPKITRWHLWTEDLSDFWSCFYACCCTGGLRGGIIEACKVCGFC